jgi:hypothetical protein
LNLRAVIMQVEASVSRLEYSSFKFWISSGHLDTA